MGSETVDLLEAVSKYAAELGQSPDLDNCKAAHYLALWLLLLPAPGLRPEGRPLEVALCICYLVGKSILRIPD